mgnify:CR=1 FL=1
MSNRLLLVEGSDMCGKTFICELMKEIIEVDKTIKDTSYKYFKFPQYDQTFGKSIMRHLVEFDPKSRHMFEEREKISNELIINKIDSLDSIMHEINKSSEKNTVIVFDRFTMSQFVYDLAWVTNPKFRKHINTFTYYDIKTKYASIVYDIYKKAFPKETEISSIYCKSSIYIKCVSQVKKGLRRVDSYDKNKLYQDTVNILFRMMYEGISYNELLECINKSKISKDKYAIRAMKDVHVETTSKVMIKQYTEHDVRVICPDIIYSEIYKSMGIEKIAKAILDQDEKYIIRFLTNPANVDTIDEAKEKYISEVKNILTEIITQGV